MKKLKKNKDNQGFIKWVIAFDKISRRSQLLFPSDAGKFCWSW